MGLGQVGEGIVIEGVVEVEDVEGQVLLYVVGVTKRECTSCLCLIRS